MEDKVLKAHLQHALRQEVQPERLEETINSCIEVMRKQKFTAEARTGFWGYLLDVFRFEGIPILGLQAITLLLVCLAIFQSVGYSKIYSTFYPVICFGYHAGNL